MNIHSGDLLYSIPEVVSGSELSESNMLAIATYKYPNKKHVILKHWMIIDIVGTEHELKNIRHTNKTPTVVYYHLKNSLPAGSLQEDNPSYSDYQISYIDGFFETEEIVYILIGKGFRKTASASLVLLLNNRAL